MIIIDFEKETFGGYSFNGVQTFYENFNDQTIVGSETTHSSNISSGGFDGRGYALKLSGVDSKRWTQVKTETGGDLYGISMTSVSFWHYPVPRYSSSDGSNYPRIFVVIWNDNNETEWQAKTVWGMAIAGNNVPMKYHITNQDSNKRITKMYLNGTQVYTWDSNANNNSESIDSSFKPIGFIAETCMATTFNSSEISEAFFVSFVEIPTTDAIFEQEELYLLCK